MLQINLSIIELAVLFTGALVLGLTIHFYIVNRRSLRQALEETNADYRRSRTFPPAPLRSFKKEEPAPSKKLKNIPEPVLAPKIKKFEREETVEMLKETIMQQQKIMNGILKKVEDIEDGGKSELKKANNELLEEISDLEARLEKKQQALDEAMHQAILGERMKDRIEEVYQEFEVLQNKMATLETQASRANNLALELEDTREAYEQVHKDLQRKNEKLEEMFLENQRLQQQVNELEDKLADSNLQRQQLHKKTAFLQELNSDLQSVSDTNKKLNTELRRVSELESMLDMIAEERDYLLRKQQKK